MDDAAVAAAVAADTMAEWPSRRVRVPLPPAPLWRYNEMDCPRGRIVRNVSLDTGDGRTRDPDPLRSDNSWMLVVANAAMKDQPVAFVYSPMFVVVVVVVVAVVVVQKNDNQ